MRAWVAVILFLLCDASMSQVSWANATHNPSNDYTQHNLALLRDIWNRSRLAVQMPHANPPAQQDSGLSPFTSNLLELLPKPVTQLLGTQLVNHILRDASNRFDNDFVESVARSQRDAAKTLSQNPAVQASQTQAQSAATVLLGTFMSSQTKQGGRELIQKVLQVANLEQQPHAGRPVASSGRSTIERHTLAFFAMISFAAIILLIPIFEYMLVEKNSTPLNMRQYSTKTIYSLVVFAVEYVLIVFALGFAVFHKLTSVTAFFDQARGSRMSFFGTIIAFVILPFALILAAATGVARSDPLTAPNFKVHTLMVVLLTIPALILFIVNWRSTHSIHKPASLFGPESSVQYRQKLEESDLQQLGQILSWFGNQRADEALEKTRANGQTTFQNLVISGNYRLIDIVLKIYNDELVATACRDSENKECPTGLEGFSAPPFSQVYHLRRLFIKASEENPSEFNSGQNEPISSSGFDSRAVSRVTKLFQTASLESLPHAQTIFDDAKSCKVREDLGASCKCAVQDSSKDDDDNCANFCSLVCVSNRVFATASADIAEGQDRFSQQSQIDSVFNSYSSYFIALALVLAATGRFFGITPECGPLMTAKGINPTPQCAMDASNCDAKPAGMVHGREWVCPTNPLQNLPENSQCLLVCEDGYRPINGMVQCRSRGFFVTEWSHVTTDGYLSECVADQDACESLLVATDISNSRVINLKNTNSIITQTSTVVDNTDKYISFQSTAVVEIEVPELPQLASGSLSAWVSLNAAARPSESAADQALFSFTTIDHIPTVSIVKGNLLTVDRASTKTYALSWAKDEWHHVKVVWDGSMPNETKAFIYIDGTLAKETDWPSSPKVDTIWFGNGRVNGIFAPLNGKMKDVRVWNRAVFDRIVAFSSFANLCAGGPVTTAAAQLAMAKALVLAQATAQEEAKAENEPLSHFLSVKYPKESSP
eukprot:c39327_g1_i1.p1 GENE.c39327_g1_i1~~c39327_g1_i1.p1  ORF type:complete len:943 (+),score=179.06 c39327_g1_i1:45-2873(+)